MMETTETALSSDALRAVLRYEPSTGVFTRIGRSQPLMARSTFGHRYIRIGSRIYLAHRLAWLYMHGSWPSGAIDHINGDPSDNRIANLRVVTQSVNLQNQRKPQTNNTSGYLGVKWSKAAGKWAAAIQVSRKSHHLGLFEDPAEAHQVYLAAKRRMHPGCTI